MSWFSIRIASSNEAAKADPPQVSPEIWLDLQSDYALRVARMTDWPKIEHRIRERAA